MRCQMRCCAGQCEARLVRCTCSTTTAHVDAHEPWRGLLCPSCTLIDPRDTDRLNLRYEALNTRRRRAPVSCAGQQVRVATLLPARMGCHGCNPLSYNLVVQPAKQGLLMVMLKSGLRCVRAYALGRQEGHSAALRCCHLRVVVLEELYIVPLKVHVLFSSEKGALTATFDSATTCDSQACHRRPIVPTLLRSSPAALPMPCE